MARRCIRCPGSIYGHDVDDLFAYSTTKMVKIRDARLGLLHYFMMILIVLYIVVYQLIALGGYLEKGPVANSVRLTLQQPTKDPKTGKNCNPNKKDCEDAFTQPKDLKYCWLPDRTKQGEFPTYNCTFLDGAEAATIRGGSIMMTTAVHDYAQTRSPDCSPGSNTCSKLWNNAKESTSYIADPENFTLMVDHSLTSLSTTPPEMEGFLFVDAGSAAQDELCRSWEAVDAVWEGGSTHKAPCYITPKKAVGKDFFSINTLLQSIGVSLDAPSGSATKRFNGLVLSMQMEYSNFYKFHLGATDGVRYVYKLSVIGNEYKETRVVSTDFPERREKQDMRGLMFVFQATGTLRTFNFTSMLLQLTTSLALVAVSTTVVNILAQYALTYSPFYNRAMYQTTHDFSDLRAANELSDAELEGELRNRGVNPHPDRMTRVEQLLNDGWQPAPTPNVSSANLEAGISSSSATSMQARAPLVAGAV